MKGFKAVMNRVDSGDHSMARKGGDIGRIFSTSMKGSGEPSRKFTGGGWVVVERNATGI